MQMNDVKFKRKVRQKMHKHDKNSDTADMQHIKENDIKLLIVLGYNQIFGGRPYQIRAFSSFLDKDVFAENLIIASYYDNNF